MPLDPNKFYHQKKSSSSRQAMLLAVEWSAIVFAGMLAVLFLSWAVELQMPSLSDSMIGENASDPRFQQQSGDLYDMDTSDVVDAVLGAGTNAVALGSRVSVRAPAGMQPLGERRAHQEH